MNSKPIKIPGPDHPMTITPAGVPKHWPQDESA